MIARVPSRARLAIGVVLACAALASPAAADPRIDYMLHCRGCHGPDGAGLNGAAPPFRGQLGRFLAVDGGREYLVRVPGTAQSELGDAKIAALLNWIVPALGGVPPSGFVPYTASEVSRYRMSPLNDVAATRRALLESPTLRRGRPVGGSMPFNPATPPIRHP
jgi:hypothetical protein